LPKVDNANGPVLRKVYLRRGLDLIYFDREVWFNAGCLYGVCESLAC